jgi:hypothetical protein
MLEGLHRVRMRLRQMHNIMPASTLMLMITCCCEVAALGMMCSCLSVPYQSDLACWTQHHMYCCHAALRSGNIVETITDTRPAGRDALADGRSCNAEQMSTMIHTGQVQRRCASVHPSISALGDLSQTASAASWPATMLKFPVIIRLHGGTSWQSLVSR